MVASLGGGLGLERAVVLRSPLVRFRVEADLALMFAMVRGGAALATAEGGGWSLVLRYWSCNFLHGLHRRLHLHFPTASI